VDPFLVLAGMAGPSAACLTSLHPWFTGEDLVFDTALVGTWVDAAAKPKQIVATPLTARLMRLGEARYLDICAGDEWTDSSMLGYLLVNSHGLARVRLEGDTLRAALLDEDRLEAMLREQRVVLPHEVVDVSGDADHPPTRMHSTGRRVLLTAPTSELQQFLAKYASDGDAFETGQVMRRRPPGGNRYNDQLDSRGTRAR
jgi:hypothetical protein